jgi:hypothetical protein
MYNNREIAKVYYRRQYEEEMRLRLKAEAEEFKEKQDPEKVPEPLIRQAPEPNTPPKLCWWQRLSKAMKRFFRQFFLLTI